MVKEIELNELITAAETARILGVTQPMINYFLRNREILFAIRIGPRAVLLRRDEIERLTGRRAAR